MASDWGLVSEMKKLTIEWKHLEKSGETCLRCSKTGKSIVQVVEEISEGLKPKGIKISFKETKLPKTEIKQSNLILINDKPLEEIISAKVSESYCPSCCDITGEGTYCRTIEKDGKVYEEIPEGLIKEAVYKVAGL